MSYFNNSNFYSTNIFISFTFIKKYKEIQTIEAVFKLNHIKKLYNLLLTKYQFI